MRIYVINGPNLNLLGIREVSIYGTKTYAQLLDFVHNVCVRENMEVECFQSNHEGVLVDVIQSALGKADGIVINPAAFAHTSIAILDALKAVNMPAVEVHLSDIYQREVFRRVSYPAMACVAHYCGTGFAGYEKALLHVKRLVEMAR